eukprot:292322-Chlamydomonas_euryale.AAC.4
MAAACKSRHTCLQYECAHMHACVMLCRYGHVCDRASHAPLGTGGEGELTLWLLLLQAAAPAAFGVLVVRNPAGYAWGVTITEGRVMHLIA